MGRQDNVEIFEDIARGKRNYMTYEEVFGE